MKSKTKALLVVAVLLVMVTSFSMMAAAEYVPIEDRGYANPEALISAEELAEIMDQEDIVVVDNRGKVGYAAGHIPGAIKIEKGEMKASAGMRLSKEDFEALFSEKGIENGDTLVVYDDHGDLYSSWLWWMARIYGHEDIRLLDGGINRWKTLGYDTKMLPDSLDASNYEAEDLNQELLATKEDVLAAIEDDSIIIQDTRAEAEYTGEKLLSGAARKGRIPSSIWLEWEDSLNNDNDYVFKTADELQEMYTDKGITDDKEIITYCQSAVRSSHALFTLTQLLGYDEVSNYDGSWVEWSNDESLPIE
ncbi:MAG: sulfurtransferase [Halanaerobium sp.]